MRRGELKRLAHVRRFAVTAALLSVAGAACGGRKVPPVPAVHPAELAAFTNDSAELRGLVTRAEAAVADGRLEEAATAYKNARELHPSGGFAPRRQCEILTALGRRSEATEACGQAIIASSNVRDLRAAVGLAMMPGPTVPTVGQFVDATQMATSAQHQLPGAPFGYTAFVDIAKRLGDWDMVRAQLLELDRVAPDAEDTQRAHVLSARPTPWGPIAGWTALSLLCLTALARVARRWRGRSSRPAGRAALATIVLCLGFSLVAHAEDKVKPPGEAKPAAAAGAPTADPDKQPEINAFSKFHIDENDPAGSLPLDKANSDPVNFAYLLMDIAGKAEDATKAGDHRKAIKYYQALAKAVPARAISYAKMCASYQALGDRQSAMDMCRRAMGSEGARLDEYRLFVGMVVDQPGEIPVREKDDVVEIIKHLRAGDAENVLAADELQCQYAVRIGDMHLLESCVAGLVKVAPKEGKTITYQWSLAMAQGNYEAAARLVQRAKYAGVKPAGIATMTEATKAMSKRRRAPVWAGFAIVGAAALLAFYFYSRRARVGRSTPNPA